VQASLNFDKTKAIPKVTIEASWKKNLAEEFQKSYFATIKQALLQQKQQGIVIYPPGPQIFNAFNLTPFHQVKVVILGQDPYHGRGQAHGLCFSVPDGIAPPPSLRNIYKEIKNNFPDYKIPTGGNLTHWAEQGIFLLNAMLTVQAGKPASHHKLGWQNFTDAVIQKLSDQKEGLIFLLWGRFAQNKATLINKDKHHILTSPHPSPFSAQYGFFGNRHFIQTNELLKKQGQLPINW